MSMNKLEQRAHNLVAQRIGSGEEVRMPWAVHELLKSMGEAPKENAADWIYCARETLYRIVKKAVDRYAPSEDQKEGEQLMMEGYKHLQAAYTTERGKDRVLVPTDQATDEELTLRAEQYFSISAGTYAHGQELLLYVDRRKEDKGGAGGALAVV